MKRFINNMNIGIIEDLSSEDLIIELCGEFYEDLDGLCIYVKSYDKQKLYRDIIDSVTGGNDIVTQIVQGGQENAFEFLKVSSDLSSYTDAFLEVQDSLFSRGRDYFVELYNLGGTKLEQSVEEDTHLEASNEEESQESVETVLSDEGSSDEILEQFNDLDASNPLTEEVKDSEDDDDFWSSFDKQSEETLEEESLGIPKEEPIISPITSFSEAGSYSLEVKDDFNNSSPITADTISEKEEDSLEIFATKNEETFQDKTPQNNEQPPIIKCESETEKSSLVTEESSSIEVDSVGININNSSEELDNISEELEESSFVPTETSVQYSENEYEYESAYSTYEGDQSKIVADLLNPNHDPILTGQLLEKARKAVIIIENGDSSYDMQTDITKEELTGAIELFETIAPSYIKEALLEVFHSAESEGDLKSCELILEAILTKLDERGVVIE